MTVEDRERWDQRYAATEPPTPRAPDLFAQYDDLLPTAGSAIDVACGIGGGSLWLARRGLSVEGFDVSPTAIELARRGAEAAGLTDRCRFAVVDLDAGLPETPPVDLVTCHRYRQPALYPVLVDRLKPGGVLALAVLSEADGDQGPFRAPKGELIEAFGDQEVLAHREGDGAAVIIIKRRR